MNAAIIFGGSGPICILTSHESIEDPALVERLDRKGIRKFIAYSIPIGLAREKYGEHGFVAHGMSLFEEELRVPLVVVPPGCCRAGLRIESPVSALDIYPTILEYAGAPLPGSLEGTSLRAQLQEPATPIIVPPLLLPAGAAAVSRGRDDEDLAREFAAALRRLPHLVLIPRDMTLAQQAADIAAGYRLRGSDAVYVAVALRFGSTLVTLDREQRERVAEALTARYPAEVLTEAA